MYGTGGYESATRFSAMGGKGMINKYSDKTLSQVMISFRTVSYQWTYIALSLLRILRNARITLQVTEVRLGHMCVRGPYVDAGLVHVKAKWT